jgi:hypothetical protein
MVTRQMDVWFTPIYRRYAFVIFVHCLLPARVGSVNFSALSHFRWWLDVLMRHDQS